MKIAVSINAADVFGIKGDLVERLIDRQKLFEIENMLSAKIIVLNLPIIDSSIFDLDFCGI